MEGRAEGRNVLGLECCRIRRVWRRRRASRVIVELHLEGGCSSISVPVAGNRTGSGNLVRSGGARFGAILVALLEALSLADVFVHRVRSRFVAGSRRRKRDAETAAYVTVSWSAHKTNPPGINTATAIATASVCAGTNMIFFGCWEESSRERGNADYRAGGVALWASALQG